MNTDDQIHQELMRYVESKHKVSADILISDPSFQDMDVDSLTKLEILLHGDDTFGSHVLDYLEDGLLTGAPPTRLSELALLIPQCMKPAKEVFLQRKLSQSVKESSDSSGVI